MFIFGLLKLGAESEQQKLFPGSQGLNFSLFTLPLCFPINNDLLRDHMLQFRLLLIGTTQLHKHWEHLVSAKLGQENDELVQIF